MRGILARVEHSTSVNLRHGDFDRAVGADRLAARIPHVDKIASIVPQLRQERAGIDACIAGTHRSVQQSLRTNIAITLIWLLGGVNP